MRKRLRLAAVGATLLVVPLAAGGQSPAVTPPPGAWSYDEGPTGPSNWANLDATFAACGSGQRQSPIDLSEPQRYDFQDPDPSYGMRPGQRQLAQGVVMLTVDPGARLMLGPDAYDLVQIHAHAPSEHTIEGRRFPAELHLVHRHASGQIAVVGVLLEEGSQSPDLWPLMPPWPAPGEVQTPEEKLAPVGLLPASLKSYQYEGSLTTPPCTEGVRWVVLATPVEASAAQLAVLADALGGNSRPLQPRNDRDLVLDEP